MKKNRLYIIISIIIVLLLVITVIHNLMYKEDIKEHFQEEKKETTTSKLLPAEDTKPSICLKPFSVTYDKDKLYSFIAALDDKITAMDYKMRTGSDALEQKYGEKFARYDKMYEWYARKTGEDQAVAKEAAEKSRAQFKDSLDKQMANIKAGASNGQPTEEASNAMIASFTGPMIAAAKATGDADNIKEVNRSLKDV